MKLHATPLPGLTLIETSASTDDRGSFTRLFCDDALASLRTPMHFSQANLSTTKRCGTVRGMHYQEPPMAEAKLIRCLRGKVYDVAVDLRAGSATFLRWHAVELSEGGHNQIYIPEGFAHGFQALTDDVQLLYFHTAPWSPSHERRLRPDDPSLAIEWPLPFGHISVRDQAASLIARDFPGVRP